MYRARPGSRGLGIIGTGPISGPTVAGVTAAGISRCSGIVESGDYWWSPSCWLYSPSAWIQMQSFAANAPSPLSTPPAGPSTVAQETQVGAWTPDQAISETETAQHMTAMQQMAAVPYVPAGGGSTGLSIADWFGNLFGGGTPTPAGLTTTSLIALGLVAGAVLLMVSSGGRRRR